MIFPNYNGKSIVNLMASINNASSKKKSMYKEAIILPSKEIDTKNIVLIVIDGLGFEFLKKHKESFLWKHNKGKLTSVFPSTTCAAISSFATGLAPTNHGFTGWFMYFKELGMVTIPLRFTTRAGKLDLSKQYKIDELFKAKPLHLPQRKQHVLVPKEIVNSAYSSHITKHARAQDYNSLEDMFSKLTKTIKKDSTNKFIYAYWPFFDDLEHHKGTLSKETQQHFRAIDAQCEKLVQNLRNTNSNIIITADHGHIDTRKSIYIEDIPRLKDCLSLPLCGESRAAFCYVKPDKVKEFKNIIRTKCKQFCTLYESQSLVNKGVFGLGTAKALEGRIGDYILIMKENYTLKDCLLGEQKKLLKSNHGGVSREEMFVPLVSIKTKEN
jgi:hypothetical protein